MLQNKPTQFVLMSAHGLLAALLPALQQGGEISLLAKAENSFIKGNFCPAKLEEKG